MQFSKIEVRIEEKTAENHSQTIYISDLKASREQTRLRVLKDD
jgi:hypothetical protein